MEDIKSKFGAKVRALREPRGLSQEKLAELSGLHRTYIGSIERGERNISIINMNRIAIAFRCSLQELVEGI